MLWTALLTISTLFALLIFIDGVAFIAYTRFVKLLVERTNKQSVSQAVKDWTLLADGASGNIELEIAWLRAAQRMFKLFQVKNHDYGSKNLAMAWTTGVVVRLADKLSRLWNLLGLDGDPKDAHVKDEKRADAFLDSGNYSMVGYLMEIGEWPEATIAENMGGPALARLVVEIVDEMTTDEQARFLEYLVAHGTVTNTGSKSAN